MMRSTAGRRFRRCVPVTRSRIWLQWVGAVALDRLLRLEGENSAHRGLLSDGEAGRARALRAGAFEPVARAAGVAKRESVGVLF